MDATLTVDGRAVAAVRVARTFAERTRGLLGSDGVDGALWLEPAQSVHTFAMRYPIDVAFVRRDGTVVRTVTLRPNRMTRLHLRARSVVEAEAGRFAAWGLRPGATVAVGAAG